MGLKSKDLHRVGQAMFGPTWQTIMADQLDVGARSVRRWAAPGGEMPSPIAARLKKLCLDRAQELLKVAAELEGRDQD